MKDKPKQLPSSAKILTKKLPPIYIHFRQQAVATGPTNAVEENHGVVSQNIMQRIDEANPTRLAQIIGSSARANCLLAVIFLPRFTSLSNSGRTLEHRL